MMHKSEERSMLAFVAVVLAVGTLACASTTDTANTNEETAVEAPQTEAETAGSVAQESGKAEVSCEMTFTMKGWSAVVSKAEGSGTVTCDNGETAEVELEVTGGGLTFGKTEIDDGHGKFTAVADINEIFGSYAQAEAHAGAVEAVSAQVLTKGEVSLAITAEGRGWSLGVSGAEFEIRRVANADTAS